MLVQYCPDEEVGAEASWGSDGPMQHLRLLLREAVRAEAEAIRHGSRTGRESKPSLLIGKGECVAYVIGVQYLLSTNTQVHRLRIKALNPLPLSRVLRRKSQTGRVAQRRVVSCRKTRCLSQAIMLNWQLSLETGWTSNNSSWSHIKLQQGSCWYYLE